MNEQLSAMVDGEVDDDVLERTFAAMGRDDALQQRWAMYHLIGDALRDEGHAGSGVSQRVMAALADEPTVLAPPRHKRSIRETASVATHRLAYSLAASVAGVAFVGLLIWQGGANHALPHADSVAQLDARTQSNGQLQLASTALPAPGSEAASQQQRMGGYWLAHRQLSGHLAAPQDGDIHFASVQVPQEAR